VLSDCEGFIEQMKAKIIEMDYMEDDFEDDNDQGSLEGSEP